jgi:transcriptional regulator with XRE-family HTH domain
VGAKGFELVVRGKLDPKVLGAELRRLREAANVTVSDLAGRMGWHTGNVSRLERGGTERGNAAREPTISSVALYVRTLGYDLVLVSRPKKPLRRTSTDAPETASNASGDE